MIVGPYDFSDTDQLNNFINDIKSEMPHDDNRNTLLDDLKYIVITLQKNDEEWEEVINELRDEITSLEEDLEECEEAR
jgi:hypothetical protein